MLIVNKLRWCYQHRLPSAFVVRSIMRTCAEAALFLLLMFTAYAIVAHNDASAAPTQAQERKAAEKAQKRMLAREQRRAREVRYESCVAACMESCRS